MVHPTNLLRSDSAGEQAFSAPVGNYFNEVDCGITLLPCLTQRLRLDKLAKVSVFIIVLSILGLLLGAVGTYFRLTSRLWFSHYNFPSLIEDWFLYVNEIFVGVLALFISYWGDRMHRTSFMGILTVLLALSGATLLIPEISNPFSNMEITNAIKGPVLCSMDKTDIYTKDIVGSEGFREVTFGYFFIFQLIFSMVTISFVSHGLTYLDDHVSAKHSPALIAGLILAAHEAGKQLGIYFSWMPFVFKIISIFLSPVWIIFMCLTMITGWALIMFPKVLPNVLIKKSVESLVSIASGRRPLDDEEVEHGFFKTIFLLLQNRILLLNILSFVLIQSALANFNMFQKFYNQSKYHVPIKENDLSGYTDPDIIQFTTTLLKQPLVTVSLITCGLLISKIRPQAKYLVIFNIVAVILMVMIFSSTIFWSCTNGIENEFNHIITIPYCSGKCGCPAHETFNPVCADGRTYFTPCLAGCKNFSKETMLYQDCGCGSVVTSGSCDEDNCKFVLALDQVNNILSNGLIATTIIVNIVIGLRCVTTKQKSTSLGLGLSLLGIVPFLPIKIIYHTIANGFCEIRNQKGCQYFSEYFPLVITGITICLLIGSIILSTILLYFLRDVNLYSTNSVKYDFNTNGQSSNEAQAPTSPIGGSLDEFRSGDEGAPFIKQLGERIKDRFRRPLSREERIQSYIENGELVPSLESKSKSILDSSTSSKHDSNPVTVQSEVSEQPSDTQTESVLNPRISGKSNSKASGESDLSSLYRFADSIVEPSDGNDSEPSLKISQGQIVFQKIPQNITMKKRKHSELPLIAIPPDSTQPTRPAPVPSFLVETNL